MVKRGLVKNSLRSEAMKGEKNHNWKGDRATIATGGDRARRWNKKSLCEICGNLQSEIHHINGNPLNNNPSNLQQLCRHHHMEVDGRLRILLLHNKKGIGYPAWNKGLTSKDDPRILCGVNLPSPRKGISSRPKKEVKFPLHDRLGERNPNWKGEAALPGSKYMRIWRLKKRGRVFNK